MDQKCVAAKLCTVGGRSRTVQRVCAVEGRGWLRNDWTMAPRTSFQLRFFCVPFAPMLGDNKVSPAGQDPHPGTQYAAAPGYATPMAYQAYPPGMANNVAQGYPPGTQPPPTQYVAAPGTQYAAPPGYPPGTTYVTTPASPTVVVYAAAPPLTQPHGWSTGICGGTSNCCNCCMVTWLPCVTYGQISARIGTNGCCMNCGCFMDGCIYMLWACMGCSCLATCLLRQAVAERVGVSINGCDDCCCSCFCGPCVLCQIANHLEIQKDGCSFGAPPKLETMQR